MRFIYGDRVWRLMPEAVRVFDGDTVEEFEDFTSDFFNDLGYDEDQVFVEKPGQYDESSESVLHKVLARKKVHLTVKNRLDKVVAELEQIDKALGQDYSIVDFGYGGIVDIIGWSSSTFTSDC